jgi:hypothetical protein
VELPLRGRRRQHDQPGRQRDDHPRQQHDHADHGRRQQRPGHQPPVRRRPRQGLDRQRRPDRPGPGRRLPPALDPAGVRLPVRADRVHAERPVLVHQRRQHPAPGQHLDRQLHRRLAQPLGRQRPTTCPAGTRSSPARTTPRSPWSPRPPARSCSPAPAWRPTAPASSCSTRATCSRCSPPGERQQRPEPVRPDRHDHQRRQGRPGDLRPQVHAGPDRHPGLRPPRGGHAADRDPRQEVHRHPAADPHRRQQPEGADGPHHRHRGQHRDHVRPAAERRPGDAGQRRRLREIAKTSTTSRSPPTRRSSCRSTCRARTPAAAPATRP